MEFKRCCTCNEYKDVSLFSKNKNSKDGLKAYCKECASIEGKKYRDKNREKVLKSKKEWYEKTKANKESRTNKEIEKGYRICTTCGIEKDISNFYKRGNGGFYAECKECSNKKQSEYHWNNRDKIILRKKEYNKRRKIEISEYNREYYAKNSEDIKCRVANWIKNNPDKSRELRIRMYHVRQARKKMLLSTFTKSEWNECKEYFKNEDGILECAYCGKKLINATQDHFIPVAKGGNYTKCNIVPVCRSCNSSKCDKDFEEWYLSKDFYSEERKEKIYEYLNSMKVNMSTPCQANEKSLEGVETR